MWDEYITGSCSRISPEAPVPVVLAKEEKRMPGGATNVLKNLVDLNISAGIMGVVGADENGLKMIRELKKWNLNAVEIWESPDRPTTIKTRILAQHQQLLRLDREYAKPIPKALENKILQVLRQMIHKYQAIILSDYDKGVLTANLIAGIMEIANASNVYVAVDPQVRHFHHYKNASLMTPNEKEASAGLGVDFPENEEEAIAIGKQIQEKLNLKHLLLTRSEKGMALFENNKSVKLIPTVAKEVFDVTGAGDTVVAVFTAAIAAGSTPLEAALLSNIAGGIVVGKLGTATASNEELQHAIEPEYLHYEEYSL
ncbi:MAG: D-glycero-beta-D-manno-heptose-7-phosphate kinase [Candidatus Hydrogenedentota bacterium]|nr:MAG: D-glycero-beta-D-manno-heptose-7-phosphate kinase [Candidatus Hydrogenedentota bacterium]